MTPADDYARAAQTLIGSCRMLALHGLPPKAQPRAEKLLTRGRITGDAGGVSPSRQARRTREGATLAAHLVHARLRAVGGAEHDQGAAAAALAAAVPVLHLSDLSARLQAARAITDVLPAAGPTETALRDVVTLLTRPAGNTAEHTAAAGHLCRTVLDTFTDLYRPWADLAYWSWCGEQLLVPDAITRAAAVALVVAGREKSQVATLAGISRTTLDKWIRQHADGFGVEFDDETLGLTEVSTDSPPHDVDEEADDVDDVDD